MRGQSDKVVAIIVTRLDSLVAGNLAQARMMIDRFKPGLILLDNYLPDGKGITLLHELMQSR
ncbi:hypothetical protein MJN54_30015, partial [Salmonella enterica subsp. enterica serovar Kentucky]|nr:hypothetical protein [Salmonella enterica subsp. enterica serovar Kentucky]